MVRFIAVGRGSAAAASRPLSDAVPQARSRPCRGREDETQLRRCVAEASVIFFRCFQTKGKSWVLKFRKRRVSLVLRGSDRCVETASPQNTAHPQVGLRKPSERLLIQHARGCVIKLLFSTAISQHQTLAGLTAASGGRGNPAEEFNPSLLRLS